MVFFLTRKYNKNKHMKLNLLLIVLFFMVIAMNNNNQQNNPLKKKNPQIPTNITLTC